MTNDVDLLDQQVEAFKRRRGMVLDDPARDMLICDAMLHAYAAAADDADTLAAGIVDATERKATRAEAAQYSALTEFSSIQRQWVDRTRAALGLPERDHKQLEEAIRAKLNMPKY